MTMTSNNDTTAQLSDRNVVTDVPATETRILSTTDGLRSFVFLGRRFSYLRSKASHGWSHEESKNVIARILFSFTEMHEGGIKVGYRLVVGSHSFWVIT
jgi:hypothetical protein